MRSLEVLFAPAEFTALRHRDLSQATCVVFDILRATTSMMSALAAGAQAIHPAAEIKEAVRLHRQHPDWLLAGEREGLRITSALTGSVDFHLGNSPREFTPEKVAKKTIAMTTTNGTRALRGCQGAQEILIGSFLNLGVLVSHLRRTKPAELLLVCSGTIEQAALEDTLAAGAVADGVWSQFKDGLVADSALMARKIYREHRHDIARGLKEARNGKRLWNIPELRKDVPFCAQVNTLRFIAGMNAEGAVVKRTRG